MAVLDNTITTQDVAPAISLDLIENTVSNISQPSAICLHPDHFFTSSMIIPCL